MFSLYGFIVSNSSQSNQGKEVVDGHYGNVKQQLEQRNKKIQKETRRQSWSGDNKVRQDSVHVKQKGQLSHSR